METELDALRATHALSRARLEALIDRHERSRHEVTLAPPTTDDTLSVLIDVVAVNSAAIERLLEMADDQSLA